MHINHSGANINIMCGSGTNQKDPNQQNNFIFNHTAPINLNFYEEVKKKQSGGLMTNKDGKSTNENQTKEIEQNVDK